MTRDQMRRDEATQNPIFLFQVKRRGTHYDTERVFYSRAEAEQWGERNSYNYRRGWRVYCVPCVGELANVLDAYDRGKSEND